MTLQKRRKKGMEWGKKREKRDKKGEGSSSGSAERGIELNTARSFYLKTRFVIIGTSFSSRSKCGLTRTYRQEKIQRTFYLRSGISSILPGMCKLAGKVRENDTIDFSRWISRSLKRGFKWNIICLPVILQHKMRK